MSSPAPEVTSGLAAVRSWCGWHIAPSATETLYVEGEGGRVMLLPSLHVSEVSEIRDESGTVVTGWKSRTNGILRGYWRCEEEYAVDLTHGYEEMPAEITEIVSDLDARSGSAGAFAQVGQVRYATGSDGAPIGASLTIAQKAILDRYKLPPRP